MPLLQLSEEVALADVTFKAYCHSVALRPGQSWLLRTRILFSTPRWGAPPFYDGYKSSRVVGNECRPSTDISGYESGYIIETSGNDTEYGNAFLKIPLVDSDGNGVWDLAQPDKGISGKYDVRLEPAWPRGSVLDGTISISRSAGSSLGQYSFTGEHSVNAPQISSFFTLTHDGELSVTSAGGAISFDPKMQKIALSGQMFGEIGGAAVYSALGKYSIENGNILFEEFSVYSSMGKSTAAPFTLYRVPKTMTFRGVFSLSDGNLSTSWPDYTEWTLEVNDNEDINGNGVPDILDGLIMPPTIASHPQALALLSGKVATFHVDAGGAPPLNYQWQREGVPIPGETRSTLVLSNVNNSMAGEYRVLVSNTIGSVVSASARLTVSPVVMTPFYDRLSATTKLMVQVAGDLPAVIFVSTNTLGPWIRWTNVVSPLDGVALLEPTRSNTNDRFFRAVVRNQTKPSEFVWVSSGAINGEYAIGNGYDPIYFKLKSLTVTNGFWICSNEVTQQEYEEVIGTNPSITKGTNRPVEMVSWDDAMEYCRRLTERDRAAGRINTKQAYRLPTADEWEYSARAGHGESRGESSELVWINASWINARPYSIRTATPNALGLYDMLGNVGEWCLDSRETNLRLVCGNGICLDDLCCRYSQRFASPRDAMNQFVGFRVVLSTDP